jgi:hypothetical protein
MSSANPFPPHEIGNRFFADDCAHNGVNELKLLSITGSWPPPNTEVKILYLPCAINQISMYTSNARESHTLRQFEEIFENEPVLDLIKTHCKEKPVALSIVRRTK